MRRVGRAGVEPRRLETRDVVLVRAARDVLADFRERLAAVAADLEIAVVRAGPVDAGHDGGFGRFDDGPELVGLQAVVLREDARHARPAAASAARPAVGVLQQRALVDVDLPAERRRHDPAHAAIARDVEPRAAEDHRARVVRREPDRRVPVVGLRPRVLGAGHDRSRVRPRRPAGTRRRLPGRLRLLRPRARRRPRHPGSAGCCASRPVVRS